MPDTQLTGQTCLITGSTSGIGKAAALALAGRGADVTIVARDAAKGEVTLTELKARSGNNAIECLPADLSSLSSIRQLADEFRRRHSNLHVLIHSAVVLKQSRMLTADGLEIMFATNHLAAFLLTNLLLDLLEASAPASVITLTAPATNALDMDDLQGEHRFNALQAFGASKVANLLFTFALARRLEGSGVVANAYHPGLVRSTGLMREAPLPMRVIGSLLNLAAVSPQKSVEGLIELATTHADGKTGQLFHGTKVIQPSTYSRDEQVQERLWVESSRLANLIV